MATVREIAGFAYFPVQFTKEGTVFDAAGEVDGEVGIRAFLKTEANAARAVTDLLVLSHGWNNNMAEAEALYTSLLGNLSTAMQAEKGLAHRRFAVLGILWPSKRFTEASLIPGGGAASFGAEPDQPSVEELRAQIATLKQAYRDSPEALKGLETAEVALPDVDGDTAQAVAARDQFLSGLRAALATEAAAIRLAGDLDGTDRFFDLSAEEIFQKLQTAVSEEDERPIDPDSGGAAGGVGSGLGSIGENVGEEDGNAQGLGDLLGKFRTAAEIIMNLTTYYTMKGRASAVGRGGAYTVLKQIAGENPSLQLHLVGHSFGGRLVASIALGPDNSEKLLLASMTLLQAAFSHNGFSPSFPDSKGGFFRRVLEEERVSGPILVTYSKQDMANGYAYPAASRLSRDDAADFGGPGDKYGSIGRNGALHLDGSASGKAVAAALLPDGTSGSYRFARGLLYNLKSDGVITAHSNETVTGVAVACAIAAALHTQ